MARRIGKPAPIETLAGIYPWNLAVDVLCSGHWGSEDEKWEHVKKYIMRVYAPGVEAAIEELNERERQVLKLRYINGLTLEKTANMFDVTRERVRQIEARALRKLHYPRRVKMYLLSTPEETEALNAENGRLRRENVTLREKVTRIKKAAGITEKEQERGFTIKDIPISDLDLSVRSYNCLSRAGYRTTDALSTLTKSQLRKVRNLGRKSVEEVLYKLAELGIELEEGDPE